MILNWIGVLLGAFAVFGGAILEGLHIEALIQPTAAIIVFGGTIGATMLASTTAEFSAAIKGVLDRKSTRLNSSHSQQSRMPSSA